MSLLPLPYIPEFAQRYGADEAVMLAVVMELVGGYDGEVVINEQRLYGRAKHLSRQQQGQLLATLNDQGLLTIELQSAGLIKLSAQLSSQLSNVPRSSQTHTAQISNSAPQVSRAQPLMKSMDRRQRDDELSRIFAVKEAEQSLQMAMHGDWQPSVNILRLLTQNMQISEAFALGLRDEFVVYYMDKDRRESPGGWDQKFLKWVKKEQVQQQSSAARSQPSTSNAQHEEARFLAREKRRQLSAAVLDLNNTDW